MGVLQVLCPTRVEVESEVFLCLCFALINARSHFEAGREKREWSSHKSSPFVNKYVRTKAHRIFGRRTARVEPQTEIESNGPTTRKRNSTGTLQKRNPCLRNLFSIGLDQGPSSEKRNTFRGMQTRYLPGPHLETIQEMFHKTNQWDALFMQQQEDQLIYNRTEWENGPQCRCVGWSSVW